MTSLIVHILSSVKTAVSALKQQTHIAAVVLVQGRTNTSHRLTQLLYDCKPESREQASKHGLYWQQDDEDSHSRKA